MQRYTYHMGFKSGGDQVETLDLGKTTEYFRLAQLYGNNIRAIDMFTSIFNNETELLNYLDKKGLIRGAGRLTLLLRDHNAKRLEVREVKSGLLYRGAYSFLNREDIIGFMRRNISNPDFILEAIKFFGIYFGSKNMPDINEETNTKELEQASARIHPLNMHLVTLDKYLEMLDFNYRLANPALVNQNTKRLAASSLKALIIMADHLIHKKSQENKGLGEIDYRGLRDVALFCYHTGNKLRPKKALPKEVELREYESPAIAHNQAYDEYLTPEEYARAYPDSSTNPPPGR